MCGLTGAWSPRQFREFRDALPAMTAALGHRGPDDSGLWFDAEAGVGLGHRRLAIVDLSPQGHQPMHSASNRYVLVYNGEIYNHTQLRRQLEAAGQAPRWLGHSDTETLLAGFAAWGVQATLGRSVGMFALALWDRERRELWLARDRLGEKPLYYGLQAGNLVFASELKALVRAPGFLGAIDRDAVGQFLRHGSISSPHSIYHGICKLPPGCWLRVDGRDMAAGTLAEPVAYWSVAEAARAGRRNRFTGSAAQATDALEALLSDAVSLQMLADVPLGAFLSGGVDSSTIVALMQSLSPRPVRTFTIGFHEDGYDEAGHAAAVARHLGTEHTELYVSADEAMAVIPQLPQVFDEPFSDSSQIPTLLVSRLARRHVTVSLSGDGGDELFLGYHRYRAATRMRQSLSRLPRPARLAMAVAARRLPDAMLRLVAAGSRAFRFHNRSDEAIRERVIKFADMLESRSADGNYVRMMTHWPDWQALAPGSQLLATAYDGADWSCGMDEFPALLGQLDLQGYLPDDILAKVDRASMSQSLESRIPLLDHRIVEFAQTLPQELKWRDGQSKWLLRQVLERHVPRALMDRPKMGFGVPIDAWLRGPLRAWGESLLSQEALQRHGFIDPAPVTRTWSEHQSGARDWQNQLWDVLMFQAWMEENRRQPVPLAASGEVRIQGDAFE